MNGTLYSQAQVVALVLEVLGPYEAVRVAKSKLIGAIQLRRARDQATRELYHQLKAALVAFYGRSNPALGQYGVRPHSQRPLTGPEKQLRAAKAKVTRQKRHTMGSRERQAI